MNGTKESIKTLAQWGYMRKYLTGIVASLLNTPVFLNFMGILDASGSSTAQLNAPAMPFSGFTMYYAYALSSPYDYVSNPVEIEILP